MKLIPNWRHAWRFRSVQLAAFGAFLAIVRTVAQHATEDPSLDWLTHAQWFAPTMALITLLIPYCRVTPQSNLPAPDPAVPAAPAASPEGNIMSMHAEDWKAIAAELPAVATMVEQIVPAGTPGVQKATAASIAIAQIVPSAAALINSQPTKWQGYLAAAVSLLNVWSSLFAKAPAPAPAQQQPAPTA